MTFLFCLLVAYVVVRASEDISAAIRKQPPPRQKIRTAKLKARAANGGQVPQSSAGRYITGLMDDAWDSAHHRRELMADERKRRQERRVAHRIERTQRRDARRDEKHARKHAAPDGPAPVGFDVDAPQPVEPEHTAPEPEPVGTAATTEASADTDPGQHDELAAQVRAAADPDPETTGEEPAPATETDEDKEDTDPSNVIPFPSTPQPTTTATPQRMELPMSTGEITGLNSAIDYATQLSTYCTHTSDQISSVLPSGTDAANSCEQARESLAAGGVTGEALSNVEAVQEQMTEAVQALNTALSQLEAAGAAAESVKTRLTSHTAVQEAYQANPDAGHREFVTAE